MANWKTYTVILFNYSSNKQFFEMNEFLFIIRLQKMYMFFFGFNRLKTLLSSIVFTVIEHDTSFCTCCN